MARPHHADSGVPLALTIAGSDSGGGAGVQADLRTFAALGVYGASAITALTAQSTVEVRAVQPVPASFVAAQIDTVLDDLPIRIAKTGMLHDRAVVEVVADRVAARGLEVVVDPVMVSESGARLLDPGAEQAIIERLFPLARLVTPNLPEVEALIGTLPATVESMVSAARALIDRGAPAALIKGGHLSGDPIDVLLERDGSPVVLGGTRIVTRATHGTGCTYSAAIAAGLAKGFALERAVREAHDYLARAIAAAAGAAPIGHGHGPVHHLHPYYPWPAKA